MIRAMVMANNSILVDTVASILAQEIGLDVLQLTYREPRSKYAAIRDHRSIVIQIDDGDVENESFAVMDPVRNDVPLLVLKISLKSRNIHIITSCQLVHPETEQVADLVRDFRRTYLGRGNEVIVTGPISQKEIP